MANNREPDIFIIQDFQEWCLCQCNKCLEFFNAAEDGENCIVIEADDTITPACPICDIQPREGDSIAHSQNEVAYTD